MQSDRPSDCSNPVVIDCLFGWLNPGTSRRGVVLCGATGFEQLSAHRAWRELADRLGATGCATLRFDYPGEGDSADAGTGTLAAWLHAIRAAVRFLREEIGVEEIVLVGLRLGGTLAVLAAEECGVDRLVLLSPFRTGQAYLREMRMRARSINALPDGTVPADPPGHLSVGGFLIGPEMARELGSIDIGALENAPAQRILLLGDASTLADRYAALGAEVERGTLAGLSLLVGNPLFAVAPKEAFARVVAYANEGALPRQRLTGHISSPPRLVGNGWYEEPAQFGPGLFGVHTRPAGPTTDKPTILFLAAGLTARSGWGRQTTKMARALAATGIPSLRLDLAGIGDSSDRPGGASPLFAATVIDDLRHALDYLCEQRAQAIVLVGSCSGAYAAFHTAYHDHRVAGALLANLSCFDWHPDDDVQAFLRQTVGNAGTYAAMLGRGTTWRRLLKGEIGVRLIGRTLTRRGLRMVLRWSKDIFRSGPIGGSVARRIATMRQRGVLLRFVYTDGDPGIPILRAKLGRTLERAGCRLGMPVVIIDDSDHNLSAPQAQIRFDQLVRAFIDQVQSRRDHVKVLLPFTYNFAMIYV